MPLAEARVGMRARVCEIRAGRAIKGRLLGLGLVPGVEVRVVRRTRRGPVVVAREGCRIVLGTGMGERIIVEEQLENPDRAGPGQ